MSLGLSGLFSKNQLQNGTVSAPSNGTGTDGTLKVRNPQNAFQVGNQLSGEVVAVNGRDVTIQLGKDQTIQAKLTSDLQVSVGQNLTFEVQKSSNGQLALRPLLTNLLMSSTAGKALEMANIPIRENTVSMVNTMMQEGMPIGSEALQKMYHELVKNQDVAPETVVNLSKLNLSVTPENVTQYTAYDNLKHQLVATVWELNQNLMDLTKSLGAQGKLSEAFGLQSQVLDIFAGSDIRFIKELSSNAMEQANDLGGSQEIDQNLNKSQVTDQSQGLKGQEVTDQSQGLKGQAVTDQSQGLKGQAVTDQFLSEKGQEVTQLSQGVKQNVSMVNETLKGAAMQELLDFGREAGFSEELLQGIQNGTVSNKQLLSFCNQLLGHIAEADVTQQNKLFAFLKTDSYQKLLSAQIGENWVLKPEQVAKEGEIGKLYDRIQKQTAQFTQALNQMGRGETPLQQTLTNLNQNLDFMHQLNQTFHYVQIPLEMNGKDTQAELYVYTNKKHLAQKDGNFSAFLHLDMERLGPVDVYVALQDSTYVNTQFYLRDEETIDFVAEHISWLDERLQSRGYNLHASVTKKAQDEPFRILDEVKQAEKENGKIGSLIGAYAFDARA